MWITVENESCESVLINTDYVIQVMEEGEKCYIFQVGDLVTTTYEDFSSIQEKIQKGKIDEKVKLVPIRSKDNLDEPPF